MKPEIKAILERTGALMAGHFVLTSGKHADAYFNKDALYPHVRDTKGLCQLLTAGVLDSGLGRLTQVVVAPEKGGIILSQWMAYLLSSYTPHDEVLGVYAEKDSWGFGFGRGYGNLVRNKKILVVEDVLTTLRAVP